MDILSLLQGFASQISQITDQVTQLQSDNAAKDAQIAQLQAGVPADTTPYSQDDMDKVNAQVTDLEGKMSDLSKADADDKAAKDAADKSLADLKAAILAVVSPAPVEAPVEQPAQPASV